MTALAWYALAGLVSLALGWFFRVDVDAGGYVDAFGTPDKREHALIAFGLSLVAGLWSRQPLGAALVTVALGAGWEWMQARPRGGISATQRRGFASWRDVVADAVGALAGAVVVAAMLAVLPHRARPPASPATLPAAVVRDSIVAEGAKVAAAKADTAYHVTAAKVATTAYTYDGARAKVPALSTADSSGRVAVDTAFVHSADSVRAALPALELASDRRHAADSTQHAADSTHVAALRAVTVAQADTIDDQRTELARRPPACRVLRMPCPSRKAALGAGAGLTLAVVVALVIAVK